MPILPPMSFLLNEQTYEFLRPERVGPVEDVRSWEWGNYPKVHALVPLQAGGTAGVYAHATHWNRSQIHVQWYDDDRESLSAWLPKDDVRPATNSEWDIDEYNRCPEWLRVVRWGKRMPGFLPE
ncbi:hypothetical protein DM793_18870 [Paenarthrobacter nitroguajacolicus]|nr:hypothetical protein [Paenarthrobacter nitroguajacolicus]